METKRQVVTTAEASEILGVSAATIRRMHSRGELRGFLSKGMGRITVASIEEVLGEPIRWPEDEPASNHLEIPDPSNPLEIPDD